MGSNRISTGLMSSQSVNFLQNNLSILTKIQNRISSQQNINTPADDPVGLTRILDLSNTLRTDDRYSKNVQDAISETNTTDQVMSNMVDLVQRVQELATQAANVTNNQQGRDAIAQEVDQIINQLVQVGNTDIGGKYIFGGLKTDAPPFTRVGDDITYSGTPSAGAWQRNTEISKGVQVTININGNDLLGQVQVSTAPPPLPATFSGASQGLFKTLIDLKQDLQTGTDPNQVSEIRKRLDELTTDMNTVLGKQAIIGSVANRLNLTQGRIDERKAIFTQQYSSIQDVNMPEAIANLNQQQNVFEASLGVTARLMQTSLMDYIH